MTKKLALLSIFAAAVASIGCNHVNPPLEGRGDPFASPQVSFADESLRNRTAIGAPRVSRDDAGGNLWVTLPIRSAITRTMTVDYKVTWYDKAGGVVSETGWMAKTLEANTPDQISVNSTSDRAADFRIALRQAK